MPTKPRKTRPKPKPPSEPTATQIEVAMSLLAGARSYNQISLEMLKDLNEMLDVMLGWARKKG